MAFGEQGLACRKLKCKKGRANKKSFNELPSVFGDLKRDEGVQRTAEWFDEFDPARQMIQRAYFQPIISNSTPKTLKTKSKHALLVGIADALGDPPFGLLHHRLALAFNIFTAQHTGTLGEVKAIRRLAESIRRSSGLLFFVFSTVLILFAK
ncbi:hypothetical protein H5410_041405 [Solanum commersonii]|uniref:Uncharacterized protein n=1 Tax=Solanum commersonii TaxID=4109 RepID=A0A9J5XRG9_SOLCO|nr:hypothetical protein H5410_041405 [Solanum commersonii]